MSVLPMKLVDVTNYHFNNGSILYQDRCENVMPLIESSSVNLLYFDPPYGIGYCSNIPGSRQWNSSEKSTKFDSTMQGDDGKSIDWNFLIPQFNRVLKPNSFVFMHTNFTLMAKLLPIFKDCDFFYRGVVVWQKKFGIGGNLDSAMKRDWEPILYMTKGKPKFNPTEVYRMIDGKKVKVIRKRISETEDWIFSLKGSEKLGHPTQKPIALAKQIIHMCTNEEDVVFDPFTGSGTIPAACNELNRNFIAVESDVEFYWMTKKRVW